MEDNLKIMTSGTALILPAGSVPRIVLSGDPLIVKFLHHTPANSWTAVVEYPDGYRRQHQVFSVLHMLEKITGQLKLRYNIDSFAFKVVPQNLDHAFNIQIGDITYAKL